VDGLSGTWKGQCAALYEMSMKNGCLAFFSMNWIARSVNRSVE
jgi:hypothetical protein